MSSPLRLVIVTILALAVSESAVDNRKTTPRPRPHSNSRPIPFTPQASDFLLPQEQKDPELLPIFYQQSIPLLIQFDLSTVKDEDFLPAGFCPDTGNVNGKPVALDSACQMIKTWRDSLPAFSFNNTFPVPKGMGGGRRRTPCQTGEDEGYGQGPHFSTTMAIHLEDLGRYKSELRACPNGGLATWLDGVFPPAAPQAKALAEAYFAKVATKKTHTAAERMEIARAYVQFMNMARMEKVVYVSKVQEAQEICRMGSIPSFLVPPVVMEVGVKQVVHSKLTPAGYKMATSSIEALYEQGVADCVTVEQKFLIVRILLSITEKDQDVRLTHLQPLPVMRNDELCQFQDLETEYVAFDAHQNKVVDKYFPVPPTPNKLKKLPAPTARLVAEDCVTAYLQNDTEAIMSYCSEKVQCFLPPKTPVVIEVPNTASGNRRGSHYYIAGKGEPSTSNNQTLEKVFLNCSTTTTTRGTTTNITTLTSYNFKLPLVGGFQLSHIPCNCSLLYKNLTLFHQPISPSCQKINVTLAATTAPFNVTLLQPSALFEEIFFRKYGAEVEETTGPPTTTSEASVPVQESTAAVPVIMTVDASATATATAAASFPSPSIPNEGFLVHSVIYILVFLLILVNLGVVIWVCKVTKRVRRNVDMEMERFAAAERELGEGVDEDLDPAQAPAPAQGPGQDEDDDAEENVDVDTGVDVDVHAPSAADPELANSLIDLREKKETSSPAPTPEVPRRNGNDDEEAGPSTSSGATARAIEKVKKKK